MPMSATTRQTCRMRRSSVPVVRGESDTP
jgi:hypothetical protein